MTDVPAAAMAAAAPAPRSALHRAVLVLAALRYVIPIAAIPLIPAWQADHLGWLLLLRPGKEIVLLAGFRARQGDIGLDVAFLAYLPLMVVAVWVFFALGRMEGTRLTESPPAWLERLAPPHVLRAGQRVLAKRGEWIAAAGRLAALPPTILAAAAGSSDVRAGRYLVADFVGAVGAFAMTIGAGWLLGDAYERAGKWITALGVVLLLVMYRLAASWVEAELDLDELDPLPHPHIDVHHDGGDDQADDDQADAESAPSLPDQPPSAAQ